MTPTVMAKKRSPREGTGRTAAEHKRRGTLVKSRHKKKPDTSQPLMPKPEHLPVEFRRVPECVLRTEADRKAAANGCWFDWRFAAHAARWIRKYLRLWEGEWRGQRFKLMRWQWREIVAPLFGWFRPDEERGVPVRRFNRAYIEVAKKNGKSPLAAAIGLYLMCGDEEGAANIYSTATHRDQAAIVHRHAKNMLASSPPELLEDRCKINASTHLLSYLPDDCIYRAVASDAGGAEGLNAHGLVADELHAWKGRAFFDSLRYATVSRRQPLFFMITTAGDDLDSVCREQHEHGRAVNAGTVVDESFLCVIYAADKADDPGDPETWRKANPSLGTTVFKSELAESHAAAGTSARAMAAFRRYRLNVWGVTEDVWLDPDAWAACREPAEEEGLHGNPACVGLDLSRSRDMTAAILAVKDGDLIRLVPRLWMPREAAERNKHLAEYQRWAAAGHLRLTENRTIDLGEIQDQLIEWAGQYEVRQILFDPAYMIGDLRRWVEDESGILNAPFKQTVLSYTAPIQEFEAGVLNRTIRHPGNPALDWQASHCLVDERNNGRILKKRQDYRTIDGIVASVMACSGWFSEAEAVQRTYNPAIC